MGCGRVGSALAAAFCEAGHQLKVLDVDVATFDSLPQGMIENGRIVPIRGDGTLEDDLRRAATQDADVFIAVSGRDTHNALAAQLAKHLLQVPKVICRIDDPVRKEVYGRLGLIAVSATGLVTEGILQAAEG